MPSLPDILANEDELRQRYNVDSPLTRVLAGKVRDTVTFPQRLIQTLAQNPVGLGLSRSDYTDVPGQEPQNPSVGMATDLAMNMVGAPMFTTNPATLGSGAVKGIRGYHTTHGDFDKFGPVPQYRGATYFAQTPEAAKKGSAGGALDYYRVPGPVNPRKTIEADIPNEGIYGLHWTPEEMKWHSGLPQRVVGDDAVNAALANQPNYRSIPWDDIYEMKHLGGDVYEYTKKPPKTYSWEEANRTTRDIYGNQLPGYSSGSDRASAKRLREQGMKGFLVNDEAGASIAHIEPETIDVIGKILGSGSTDKRTAAMVQGLKLGRSEEANDLRLARELYGRDEKTLRDVWQKHGPERDWLELPEKPWNKVVSEWNAQKPGQQVNPDRYMLGTYPEFEKFVESKSPVGRQPFPGRQRALEWLVENDPLDLMAKALENIK